MVPKREFLVVFEMAVNIKSDHAHGLVKERSEFTGESQIAGSDYLVGEHIGRASREKERGKNVEALLALGKRIAPLLNPPKGADHTAWMYDENGLPH